MTSRLTRIFSKKKTKDEILGDSDEDGGGNLYDSDTETQSNQEWGDWSVHEGSTREDDEMMVPLNDADRGAKTRGGDDKEAAKESLKRIEDERAVEEDGESDNDLDVSTKDTGSSKGDSKSEKKKSKKKKSKEKKKKKKNKPVVIGDIDVASLASSERSVTDSMSQSTKAGADDSSVRSGNSSKKEKKKKNAESDAEKSKKDRKKKKKGKSEVMTESSLIPSGVVADAAIDDGLAPLSGKSSRRKSSRSSKKENRLVAVPNNGSSYAAVGFLAESQALVPSPLNYSTGSVEDALRQEILRLHQMLSDTLQKMAIQSAEQIQDKDQYLRISADLAKSRGELDVIVKERDTLKGTVGDRDKEIENSLQRIDKLEVAIEKQLDEQDRMEAKLVRSEDEIDKLLIEIQDLEREVDVSGAGVTDETLRSELKEAKKTLIDKGREIEDQKLRIEHLEKELQESSTVNKLQVDELELEKKGLQGKLKGERLESSTKLALRDDTIANLQKELSRFRGNSEYEELAVVRGNLERITAELETANNETDVAQRMLNKAKKDKEELLDRNNALNEKVKTLQRSVNELTDKSRDLGEKVLKWTEQTYEWKARAESAEKKVGALADSSDAGSEAESIDEAPQGLFLQAVMDKQETSKKASNPWNLIASALGGEDDMTSDELRINQLQEQNTEMGETIAELRSEIVKMQTMHKEEIYSTNKKMAQLQGENEALSLQNTTLEALCEKKE